MRAWTLILGVGLGAVALPGMAAEPAQKPAVQAKAKVDVKADAKVGTQEDDALTAEQLKIQEGGRWQGLPIPKPLDEKALSPEEKALYKRVKARWQALVEFDLKKVYAFATPSYRKTYNQTHLNSQYHNKIARTGTDIVEIKFEDDKKTQARVKVKLKFQAMPAGVPQPIEGVSWENDTWVKVDGEWYYVEAR